MIFQLYFFFQKLFMLAYLNPKANRNLTFIRRFFLLNIEYAYFTWNMNETTLFWYPDFRKKKWLTLQYFLMLD